MVLSATDILEELNLSLVTEHKQARAALPADETEKRLLASLSAEATHVDDLGVQLNLPIALVYEFPGPDGVEGHGAASGRDELCGG